MATIRIADPMRTGTPVEVVWAHPVRGVTAKDPGVEVLAACRSLRLRVTAGTTGATHACEVVVG